MVKISETVDKTLTDVTKITGVSAEVAGGAKCRVDILEAVAYQDGVYAVISDIGVCADGLSVDASFIPDPSVTTIVRLLVSVGWKVFVYCCKKAKRIP